MKPISEIAAQLGIDPQKLIMYGDFKAKIPLDTISNKKTGTGKLIVVTGITPTPAGEGKTTTAVGLAQGMGLLGKNVVATLREPSLGPIFGIKGGGTGGGAAKVIPEDEINIHFTGDAHAVGSAHNLLVALTENAAHRKQIPGFTASGISLSRVTDMEHRSLRQIVTGIGGPNNLPVRETGFDIVTASEIMAILALSSDLEDLRRRLGKVIVGFTQSDEPIAASSIEGAVGSMMALLRTAIMPNLVQTSEGQPVIIHSGPFGNIAHGCSSVIGDRIALNYADYVLTEAGFGADLGFEKFIHIKSRLSNLNPHAVVLVATIKGLKYHGGVKVKDLDQENTVALSKGLSNLRHLIQVIKSFGLPVIVAVNEFPNDTPSEIKIVQKGSIEAGASAAVSNTSFVDGGSGCKELAEAVIDITPDSPVKIKYAYDLSDSIENKVLAVSKLVYNASDVNWSPKSRRIVRRYTELGWSNTPICMAKTPLSISHDSKLKGKPENYTFEVNDIRASMGAGFTYPIAGNIVTMPGLPSKPRSLDVDKYGNILGL
ncbi:MAG: formate--tetrahydrofolate ligase [Dehalococcoidia bacterium]|nr:formate--tetrahydrofolate ligase [Dehalococcoidia bacterium]|tara:strand:- start:2725 stop:4353 length:1629 start_codon:yes stop_codon:yes gene_type:complete